MQARGNQLASVSVRGANNVSCLAMCCWQSLKFACNAEEHTTAQVVGDIQSVLRAPLRHVAHVQVLPAAGVLAALQLVGVLPCTALYSPTCCN